MADTMTENDKKEKKGAKGLSTALGLTALAAGAAAGYYYFYAHPEAEANRKKIAKWADDFKDEALTQLEKAKRIDKATVAAAIDRAVSVYKNARAVNTVELLRAASELKDHWKSFSSDRTVKVRGAISKAKKATRSKKTTRTRGKK